MMTDSRTIQPEMSRKYDHLTKPEKIAPASCYRCGGVGGFDGWPGFTCFRCGGNGVDPTYKEWGFPSSYTVDEMLAFYDKKDEVNRKARERRAVKKQEKREEQLARNMVTFPGFVDIVLSIKENGLTGNGFVDDVYSKAYDFPLSEAQADAAVSVFQQEQEFAAVEEARQASVPPIETADGVSVEGEVVTTKWKDNQWGGGMKMLVLTDNEQKLWGTIPTTLADVQVGERVSFVANIAASTDDPIFGFFSRPRKGEILG